MLHLLEIDEHLKDDHYYLDEEDHFFYLGEYTQGGYEKSPTNQLIFNLKTSLEHKGEPRWKHKGLAIKRIANYLINGTKGLEDYVLIPIPPSKMKNNPLYDDRICKVLELVEETVDINVEDVFQLKEDRVPSHKSTKRPRPEELMNLFQVDLDSLLLIDKPIILVDDVITTGSHFKACKNIITKHINVGVMGLFVARSAIEKPLLLT